MSSLTTYKNLSVITPDPTGLGGLAINNNFKALADRFAFLDTTDPTTSDDSSAGFAVGSRWFNTTTSVEWICTDASIGAAVWVEPTPTTIGGTITESQVVNLTTDLASKLPLSGGEITGNLIIDGSLSFGSGSPTISLNGTSIQTSGGVVLDDGSGQGNIAVPNYCSVGDLIAGNIVLSGAGTLAFGFGPTPYLSSSAGNISTSAGPNVLDDGAGNMTVAGGITAGSITSGFYFISGSGNIKSDGNEGVSITDQESAITLTVNATSLGTSNGIFSSTGTVLDDGSGNMTVIGQITSNSGFKFPDSTIQTTAYTGVPTLAAVTSAGATTMSACTFGPISGTTITASSGFSGPGSSLTSLNGTNISTGTVADARLSSNVPLKNGSNTFTGTNTFAAITATHVGGTSGTPTTTLFAGAGTGATCTVKGTDVAGTISLTIGTGPSGSATLLEVTFHTAYGTAPTVIVIGTNVAALSALASGAVHYTVATGYFYFSSGAAPTAGTNFLFAYHVLGN